MRSFAPKLMGGGFQEEYPWSQRGQRLSSQPSSVPPLWHGSRESQEAQESWRGSLQRRNSSTGSFQQMKTLN